MTNFRVLALDLSLRATGIAGSIPTPWTATISVSTTGCQRFRDITNEIFDRIRTPHLVVIEGPSYGSGTGDRQQGHHERAGLWWHTTYRLWRVEIPFAVVPPSVLKKYATGRGNASKQEVLLAAARRYPGVDIANDNEADAVVLLALALDHLGEPLAEVPQTHRAALDKIAWPEVAL